MSKRPEVKWSFPAATHPPDGWPYTWPVPRELHSLKGKRVLIGGVSWAGWKSEFECIIKDIVGFPPRLLTDHPSQPELRHVFAIQDLKTGRVFKCAELD